MHRHTYAHAHAHTHDSQMRISLALGVIGFQWQAYENLYIKIAKLEIRKFSGAVTSFTMRKAIWTIWRLEIEREIGMEMGRGRGWLRGVFHTVIMVCSNTISNGIIGGFYYFLTLFIFCLLNKITVNRYFCHREDQNQIMTSFWISCACLSLLLRQQC